MENTSVIRFKRNSGGLRKKKKEQNLSTFLWFVSRDRYILHDPALQRKVI